MLTKTIVAICLMAAAGLPMAVLAETPDLARVVKTLENPFQNEASPQGAIRDFTADFHQESRIVSLDRVQQGQGRVTIKFGGGRTGQPLPAKFRWEYQQPARQEIVSDGRVLWVYVPENRQVFRSELDRVGPPGADNPLTFLTGLGNLSRDFAIDWADPKRTEAGDWVLALTPRQPSAILSRLLIVVDQRAVQAFAKQGRAGSYFPILASTAVDPNHNTTRIEFSNAQVNRGPADSVFSFTPPPGVEVVSPTLTEPGT